jgi:hypothetical protein
LGFLRQPAQQMEGYIARFFAVNELNSVGGNALLRSNPPFQSQAAAHADWVPIACKKLSFTPSSTRTICSA